MSLEDGIPGMPSGWKVRHVAQTGSTNADLLADAEAGREGHRSVLLTDHQVAGRGRLDRRWEAPPGTNLLVSLLFTDVEGAPGRLSQEVGVAAVEAVERLADRRGVAPPQRGTLGLKWPNDVLLGDRKLAGILAQRSVATGAVVVGIGLNVGWAPDGAASLAGDLGLDVRPVELLAELLDSFDLDVLAEPTPPHVAARYRDRLLTLGQAVRVELPADEQLFGTAVDVDGAGRLVVDDDRGVRHVLDVGDVVHLRPV